MLFSLVFSVSESLKQGEKNYYLAVRILYFGEI